LGRHLCMRVGVTVAVGVRTVVVVGVAVTVFVVVRVHVSHWWLRRGVHRSRRRRGTVIGVLASCETGEVVVVRTSLILRILPIRTALGHLLCVRVGVTVTVGVLAVVVVGVAVLVVVRVHVSHWRLRSGIHRSRRWGGTIISVLASCETVVVVIVRTALGRHLCVRVGVTVAVGVLAVVVVRVAVLVVVGVHVSHWRLRSGIHWSRRRGSTIIGVLTSDDAGKVVIVRPSLILRVLPIRTALGDLLCVRVGVAMAVGVLTIVVMGVAVLVVVGVHVSHWRLRSGIHRSRRWGGTIISILTRHKCVDSIDSSSNLMEMMRRARGVLEHLTAKHALNFASSHSNAVGAAEAGGSKSRTGEKGSGNNGGSELDHIDLFELKS
jgi:hypothetical protein